MGSPKMLEPQLPVERADLSLLAMILLSKMVDAFLRMTFSSLELFSLSMTALALGIMLFLRADLNKLPSSSPASSTLFFPKWSRSYSSPYLRKELMSCLAILPRKWALALWLISSVPMWGSSLVFKFSRAMIDSPLFSTPPRSMYLPM